MTDIQYKGHPTTNCVCW